MRKRGSPEMADPKHPRKFSEGFKRQVVQLYDNGKSAADIHREYDICKSTLRRLVKGIHESGSTKAEDNRTPEQARIIELEKESKQLRMEVEVSKTAALIFARR